MYPTRPSLSAGKLTVNKSIHKTFLFSMIIVSCLSIGLLSYFWISYEYSKFKTESQELKNAYIDEQKKIIQNEVERVIEYIEYKKTAAESKFIRQDIENNTQQKTLDWINKIRFGKNGYIFVYSFDAITLAHYKPGNIGINQWDYTDPNGIKVLQDLIRLSKNEEGGFLEYTGTIRPTTGLPAPKISYAKSVPDWEWMVGAGVYIDDIELALAKKQKLIKAKIKSHLIKIVFTLLGSIFVISIISKLISRQIMKSFDIFLSFFEKASTESIKIDLQNIYFLEFRNLAYSANQMINQRIHAEEALRESEEKLKAIFEANPDPVVVYNANGHPLHLNIAFTELFGWHLNELQGKQIPFVPEDQQAMAKLKTNEIYEFGNTVQFETKRTSKDGKSIDILLSAAIIKDVQGTSSGLVVNLKDITDRKKLETQLRQAQKMESIGTLAGGIAHDFNNILFPVLGYTEMLLKDIPEKSLTHDRLKKIYAGAIRARDLVKQILTFSRQENNEIKRITMQPVIKEALKLIRSTIPTTIEIKQNIQKECGIVKADPTQIHQIIMNLTTNAYHAMEDRGGELKVTLKEIESAEYDRITPDMLPGVYACLTVGDTGRGIDKNITEKIFDPFFTTKQKGKGTGMGLSVVHGIVKSMGGAVKVYSEPDKGSEFHVYLPVVKNVSEEQNSQTEEPIQKGTERILLVDDEEDIVIMAGEVLERLGYQVTSHTSSIEALEVFRTAPDQFDMVITDLAMPKMPGDKLSTELIKIRPGIPILLCTGFSETMSEENAASLGIKGYLIKPVVMKDLSRKIREVLDKK